MSLTKDLCLPAPSPRPPACFKLVSIVKRTLAFALALLGLFVSIYLLWVYASPSHPMVCLGGSGCDEVRGSAYAHILGIPTPAYGVAFYLLVALLIFLEARTLPLSRKNKQVADTRSPLPTLILALSALGVLVSAALTYIEAAVVHAWCAWCVTQAIAVVLIFLLWLAIVLGERNGHREIMRTATLTNVALAAFAVGCIAFYLLQRAEAHIPPPPPSLEAISAKLVRPDSHVTGNPQSLVTFVEFGDLQCPACVASYPIVEQLRNAFADRVRFVFRQYPLESIHLYALGAAEAAECAATQGRFWPMLDRMYASKGQLDDPSLQRYATELGLDVPRFRQCLSSDETLATIRRDQQDALALGVRSTPTFFVGKRRIEGALPFNQFAELLNEDLAACGSGCVQPAQATTSQSTAHGPEKQQAGQTQSPAAARANAQQTAKASGGALPGQSGGFFTVKGSSVDCSTDAAKGPEPPLIHTADAQKDHRRGAVFVDVRSSDDFAKGHIQSARNIPLLEVETRAGELPKDTTLVVYEAGTAAGDVCAAAKSAARVLISRGHKAVVYQDGLKDWEKSGGAVEK